MVVRFDDRELTAGELHDILETLPNVPAPENGSMGKAVPTQVMTQWLQFAAVESTLESRGFGPTDQDAADALADSVANPALDPSSASGEYQLRLGTILIALSRYANDVSEGFRLAVSEAEGGEGNADIARLLRSLSFHQVDIFDGGNRIAASLMAPEPDSQTIRPSAETLGQLRALAVGANGEVAFSNLMRENETPVFFVVRQLSDGRVAIGALAFLRRGDEEYRYPGSAA